MNRASWAVFAALGFASTPALAADIDEVSASLASASAVLDSSEDLDAAARRRPQHRRPPPPPPRRAVRGRPHPTPRTAARPATRRPPPPRASVRYRRVTPVHGVFVYGPPPRHHHYYPARQTQVQRTHLPARQVDRNHSLALGLKGGTFFSGTTDGDLYSDPGLGLMARYRPAEAVGLQLDVSHHAGLTSFAASESQRNQTQASGSVALFAYPWSRVSPYVIGGVTWNGRALQDRYFTEGGTTVDTTEDVLTGLHGGVGLSLGLGQKVALELEGRYIGYLDGSAADPVGALQGTGGLVFHF